MSDGTPEWFAPKRYGYGARPVTWQGWAITFAFVIFLLAVTAWFRDRRLVEGAIVVPVFVAFLVVVAKTTRGGWRWRWGDED